MTSKERIELSPPLPGDAQGGTVSFFVLRGGMLPGWRAAPRGEATHARIELRGLDGETEKREVARDEAEEFLAEVERMHAATEAASARSREGGDRVSGDRATVAGAINLSCPRCGIPRRYEGRRNLVSAGSPDDTVSEDAGSLSRPETRAYEEYACPQCGSVELFRAGKVEHPLPGSAD